MEASGFEKKF
jgi:hypothetical protein